jgi:hypothetical protein
MVLAGSRGDVVFGVGAHLDSRLSFHKHSALLSALHVVLRPVVHAWPSAQSLFERLYLLDLVFLRRLALPNHSFNLLCALNLIAARAYSISAHAVMSLFYLCPLN